MPPVIPLILARRYRRLLHLNHTWDQYSQTRLDATGSPACHQCPHPPRVVARYSQRPSLMRQHGYCGSNFAEAALPGTRSTIGNTRKILSFWSSGPWLPVVLRSLKGLVLILSLPSGLPQLMRQHGCYGSNFAGITKQPGSKIGNAAIHL